jgi:outer membrane protein OmpA-like peptidoglycan-associated protein
MEPEIHTHRTLRPLATRPGGVAAALALVVVAAACGPRQNRALEDARAAYLGARSDPAVVQYAAAPLQQAEKTLEEAGREHRDGDAEETRHLAYVAQQEVARARQIATEKQARAQSEALSESRQEVVLETREQEVALLLAELAALKARETEQGVLLTLSDVFFEFDKAALTPGAAQDLTRLAQFLKAHPDRTMVIEGHTDSIGSDSYNVDLSRRRAMSVRSFLSAQGVSRSQLVAQGFGESFPVASNDSEAGRQQNRRVEMLVMNPGREVTISSTPIIIRR